MKDCFGLHGHSAFGSVAKDKSGVGQQSLLSQVQLTDLVHWLQAGKTVDILRCAAESTDLLSPSALLRPLRYLQLPRPPALRRADYRLPPVIVLPLLMVMLLLLVVVALDETNRCACASVVIYLLVLFVYIVI